MRLLYLIAKVCTGLEKLHSTSNVRGADVYEIENRGYVLQFRTSCKRCVRQKEGGFGNCVPSVNAMYFLLENHPCPPKALSLDAEWIMSGFWCEDADEIVQEKLADKQVYGDKVRELFGGWF